MDKTKDSKTNIVWVDSTINNKPGKKMQEHLKQKINEKVKSAELLSVDNIQSGLDAIKKSEKCVIIVSTNFGQDLVSKVHDDTNVLSIWVFSGKSSLEANKKLAAKFSKLSD